jgi:hypothetical protein
MKKKYDEVKGKLDSVSSSSRKKIKIVDEPTLFYEEIIEKYKNSYIIEYLLNVILVNEKIRSAYLFESTNYDKHENYAEKFFNVVREINDLNKKKSGNILKIAKDNHVFPRYFVFLKGSFVDKEIEKNPKNVDDDIKIATFLDFQCVGHDYTNTLVNRDTYNIHITEEATKNEFAIIVEVCEHGKNKDKILNAKNKLVQSINNLLNKYGYNAKLNFKVSYSLQHKINFLKKEEIEADEFETIENLLRNYFLDNNLESSETYKKLRNFNTLSKTHKYKLQVLCEFLTIYDMFFPLFRKLKNKTDLNDIEMIILSFDKAFWSIKSDDELKFLEIGIDEKEEIENLLRDNFLDYKLENSNIFKKLQTFNTLSKTEKYKFQILCEFLCIHKIFKNIYTDVENAKDLDTVDKLLFSFDDAFWL